MSAKPAEFGSWHTATDGMAHYIVAGKCLCGAKVKTTDPPVKREAKSHAIVTLLCERCMDLNAARWAGKKGTQAGGFIQRLPLRWWRQPRMQRARK
jgi:hypothetical protein